MSPDPDAAALYAETRQSLIDRCAELADDAVERVVPLTPDWTIKDVIAHVCGINADFLAGRLEGLGSDAWTARQVEERQGKSIAEICDEWTSHAAQVDAVLAGSPDLAPRLLGDLIVHLHDIDQALDLEPDRDSPATIVGARRYAPQLQERVRSTLDIGLSIDLGPGGAFDAPMAATTLHLVATPYEFLRAVTGRRSRSQVGRFDWRGDIELVDRLIDTAISSYGPLQSADVTV